MSKSPKVRRCRKCGQLFTDLVGRCPTCQCRTSKRRREIALMILGVCIALGLLAVTWFLLTRQLED